MKVWQRMSGRHQQKKRRVGGGESGEKKAEKSESLSFHPPGDRRNICPFIPLQALATFQSFTHSDSQLCFLGGMGGLLGTPPPVSFLSYYRPSACPFARAPTFEPLFRPLGLQVLQTPPTPPQTFFPRARGYGEIFMGGGIFGTPECHSVVQGANVTFFPENSSF